MKLYASTAPGQLRLVRHLGYDLVLLSYAESKLDTIAACAFRFAGTLLDSGAYSVATGRHVVDLERYIDTCRALGSALDAYANLDVIGDWRATEANQRRMEAAGLAPLPTFHYGSPWGVLRALVETYDYVGIGGVARAGRKRMPWLDRVWSLIQATRWPIKVHGWGITSSSALERYPWYSVDSTTWKTGDMYGTTLERVGHRMTMRARVDLDRGYTHHTRLGAMLRLRKSARTLQGYVDQVTRTWALRGVSWDS